MSDTSDLITEGCALLAAADPAPWRSEPSKYVHGRYVIASDNRQIMHAAGIANRAEDAELIVWMRNNVPALLARIAELEAEVDLLTGLTLGEEM
jgi:hypothetical protein